SYIAPIERDGTIFIPQVGSIAVAGATFSEVKKLIRARLGGLLKRFEMHLSMARLRTIKVYVVGEVVRPGAYEISSLATASHALYAACGPTRAGSLRTIQVVREGAVAAELDFYDFFLRGDRTQDVRLRSGDTILVPPIGSVVAVAGPVRRPAIYELEAATTLTGLLELAGGLLPTADRRQVQIFRVEAGRHRVILDVELGDLLNQAKGRKDPGSVPSNPPANPPSGKSSSEPQPVIDPLIKDGDFVRVASVPTQIENAVSLTGAVRNPGPYEFRPGMRLLDLLTPEQMLVDSYRERAELIRTDPITYEPTVMTFSPERLFRGDPNENIPLQRLDKVMVPTQIRPPKIVRVSGEVKRPGVYTIETGERLSSVLTRAGGLRERAFPEGLVLIRESVRRSQQAEVQKFLALQKQKLIAESASLASGAVGVSGPQASAAGQEQIALQLQLQALDQLVSRIQLGRVVVKMDSLESLEGSDEDIMLEQGDHVTVPQQPQTVSVIGAVRNPTSVVHHDGLAVDDYIQMAGDYTPDARKGEVYILRANGSTDSSYVRVKAVKAGDTVVVPARIESKTRPLPLWQEIASIVGSVALAAAGIAVIGR
ncbi:MAG: SLBB domain-containing protein, partial [Nitrospirales bacterium]